MKNRSVLTFLTLIILSMILVFAAIYHQTGKLPLKIVGLIAATCLPPVGMLAYISRGRKR
jgi:hypothetical protein